MADLRDLNLFIKRFKDYGISNVIAESLDKAVKEFKTDLAMELKKEIRLSDQEINDSLTITETKRSGANTFVKSIEISSRPIPLKHFVTSPVEVEEQKDKTVRARRAVIAEVKPGMRRAVRGAFIARANQGTDVFRRETTEGLPIRKLVVPSIGSLFKKAGFARAFMQRSASKFNKIFNETLEREIQKA